MYVNDPLRYSRNVSEIRGIWVNPAKAQALWNAKRKYPMNRENEGSDTTREDVERIFEIIRKISKYYTVADQKLSVEKMTRFWKFLKIMISQKFLKND